ncbi:MAG: hypothetical protein KIT84_15595 [Labilithrix sp.]|nr:hypothetical protein [Labilithrix sp.]MCW5812450.1 hypothetical protein [Labilithrix sp.]
MGTRRLFAAVLLTSLALAAPAGAESTRGDRVAVRFVTPETGGAARPRFITERELAFFTRIEALVEQAPLEASDYPERYVRAALDRFVARTMLANLMIQRGVEPPDLGRLALEGRSELEQRIGGPNVLLDVMKREGIEEDELLAFLRDQARAAFYVDRTITPILAVSEDALREAHRAMLHPFRGKPFDKVRADLRRWLVVERLRAAETEFLQSARARVRVVTILTPTSKQADKP